MCGTLFVKIGIRQREDQQRENECIQPDSVLFVRDGAVDKLRTRKVEFEISTAAAPEAGQQQK